MKKVLKSLTKSIPVTEAVRNSVALPHSIVPLFFGFS